MLWKPLQHTSDNYFLISNIKVKIYDRIQTLFGLPHPFQKRNYFYSSRNLPLREKAESTFNVTQEYSHLSLVFPVAHVHTTSQDAPTTLEDLFLSSNLLYNSRITPVESILCLFVDWKKGISQGMNEERCHLVVSNISFQLLAHFLLSITVMHGHFRVLMGLNGVCILPRRLGSISLCHSIHHLQDPKIGAAGSNFSRWG